MQIIKEAVVGEYHFIVSKDYLAVTMNGEELVVLNRNDAQEVTTWLFSELNGAKVAPTVAETPQNVSVSAPVAVPRKYVAVPSAEELGTRQSRQTVPMKDSNPFAAQGVLGSTGPAGDTIKVLNLAAEAASSGAPLIPSNTNIRP